MSILSIISNSSERLFSYHSNFTICLLVNFFIIVIPMDCGTLMSTKKDWYREGGKSCIIGQRRVQKKPDVNAYTKRVEFFVRLKIRIHRNSNIMSSLKDKQAMKIPFPFRRCKRALRNFLNCDETYYLVIKITACNSHLQRKYLPEWNAKMPIIL